MVVAQRSIQRSRLERVEQHAGGTASQQALATIRPPFQWQAEGLISSAAGLMAYLPEQGASQHRQLEKGHEGQEVGFSVHVNLPASRRHKRGGSLCKGSKHTRQARDAAHGPLQCCCWMATARLADSCGPAVSATHMAGRACGARLLVQRPDTGVEARVDAELALRLAAGQHQPAMHIHIAAQQVHRLVHELPGAPQGCRQLPPRQQACTVAGQGAGRPCCTCSRW